MDSAIAPARALPVVITPGLDKLVFGGFDEMFAGNYLPEFAPTSMRIEPSSS